MGLFDRRRRSEFERSVNWDLLIPMMVAGHELGLAEEEGLTGDGQGERAARTREAVLDEVGREHFRRVFIDTNYEMQTYSDADLIFGEVLKRSGYNAARNRLEGR